MFRKLRDLFGGDGAKPGEGSGAPFPAPYRQPETNRIYNLLFCDDLEAFRPAPGASPAPWQQVLYRTPGDADRVRALADDADQEGRVRALALHWLRAQGLPVPAGILLGVVVEVPLERGLDVLAAFSDGGVRYLNQTGKLAVVEGGTPATAPIVARLLQASRALVSQIGPWEKPRLAPPKEGRIRLTFLVSDGLYFGEGPMAAMQQDPLAGPVIQQAIALLQAVVDVAAP